LIELNAAAVAKLVAALPRNELRAIHEIPECLRVMRDGALEAFYAPFDFETPAACIAIVRMR
jgi:hypothetical protein